MVMDLIGNLMGKAATAAPAKAGYYSAMVIEDGDAAYDTVAKVIALVPAAGVKARLWEFTVPAQLAYTWGYGNPNEPANQGYIWLCGLDTNVDFSVGTVLLSHENHSRRMSIPVFEFNDGSTHTATITTLATSRSNDKNQLLALPEGGKNGKATPLVGQDSRLVIDYTTITAATAIDIMGFNIPVTIHE